MLMRYDICIFRIQMTVSLMRTITESQNVFPMSICLARRVSDYGSSRVGILLLIS